MWLIYSLRKILEVYQLLLKLHFSKHITPLYITDLITLSGKHLGIQTAVKEGLAIYNTVEPPNKGHGWDKEFCPS